VFQYLPTRQRGERLPISVYRAMFDAGMLQPTTSSMAWKRARYDQTSVASAKNQLSPSLQPRFRRVLASPKHFGLPRNGLPF